MEFRKTNIAVAYDEQGEAESAVVSLTATSSNQEVYASATVTVKGTDLEEGQVMDDLSSKDLFNLAFAKFKKEVE